MEEKLRTKYDFSEELHILFPCLVLVWVFESLFVRGWFSSGCGNKSIFLHNSSFKPSYHRMKIGSRWRGGRLINKEDLNERKRSCG